MPTDFNGDTLIITLPAGQVEVDLFDDIYEPWKDWMLSSPLNRGYPAAFRSDGGNPLSSIINQGSYIFLNNSAGWRIKPPEEDITIYLTGNLAVEDTTLPAFIPTTGAFTAAILGLQPVTQGVTPEMAAQLQYSSYQNKVTIDQINGETGTVHPTGTPTNPALLMSDAYAIAQREGFNTYEFIGDGSIGTVNDYTGSIFIGESRVKSHITVPAAATVPGAEFYFAHVLGTLDGDSILTHCRIDDISYINGEVNDSILDAGVITLGGGAAARFSRCESGVPGVLTPIIDMGGAGQSLYMDKYGGGVTLRNKTGVDKVSINLAAGQVILEDTVNNGEVVVRGPGKLVDSNGDSILSGTWNGATIVNETIHGEHIHEMYMLMGLDAANPVTISDAQQTVAGITLDITDNGTTTTITRRTAQFKSDTTNYTADTINYTADMR